MPYKFDFLIVGSGLFGSVFARLAAEKNKKVLIVEKRNHIGGNCYTENINGIHIHQYGPHLFHTNSKKIWDFINRFAEFNNYQYHPRVFFKGKIYSFPINLMTLYQMWGVKTPEEAKIKLESVRIKKENPQNLEEWILDQVGEELYETFIKGYTTKQWGRHPSTLPTFIIRRLPIRLNYDDRYFDDKYQGIPIGGYTQIFEKMLDHPNIETKINVDFFEDKTELVNSANKIVYTGKIDDFYNQCYGPLEYRSLRFETKILNTENYQGVSVINNTEEFTPYTRTIEHKHFENSQSSKTVVTWEYPDEYLPNKIPYYPINDKKNNELYEKYRSIKNDKILFAGRLGTYKYFDMDATIAQAITLFNKENI